MSAPPQVDVKTAIASAMASYMPAGLVGLLMYSRNKSIAWSATSVLLISCAPAAFVASFIIDSIDEKIIKVSKYAMQQYETPYCCARECSVPSTPA
eukprot:SAG31_NODE_2749_length_5147_cov_1.972662_4_plen_96_part_00